MPLAVKLAIHALQGTLQADKAKVRTSQKSPPPAETVVSLAE